MPPLPENLKSECCGAKIRICADKPYDCVVCMKCDKHNTAPYPRNPTPPKAPTEPCCGRCGMNKECKLTPACLHHQDIFAENKNPEAPTEEIIKLADQQVVTDLTNKCPHGCPWKHQPEHWHYKNVANKNPEQPTPPPPKPLTKEVVNEFLSEALKPGEILSKNSPTEPKEWEKLLDQRFGSGDEYIINGNSHGMKKALKSIIAQIELSVHQKARQEGYEKGAADGMRGKYFTSLDITEEVNLAPEIKQHIQQAERESLIREIEGMLRKKWVTASLEENPTISSAKMTAYEELQELLSALKNPSTKE